MLCYDASHHLLQQYILSLMNMDSRRQSIHPRQIPTLANFLIVVSTPSCLRYDVSHLYRREHSRRVSLCFIARKETDASELASAEAHDGPTRILKRTKSAFNFDTRGSVVHRPRVLAAGAVVENRLSLVDAPELQRVVRHGAVPALGTRLVDGGP